MHAAVAQLYVYYCSHHDAFCCSCCYRRFHCHCHYCYRVVSSCVVYMSFAVLQHGILIQACGLGSVAGLLQLQNRAMAVMQRTGAVIHGGETLQFDPALCI